MTPAIDIRSLGGLHGPRRLAITRHRLPGSYGVVDGTEARARAADYLRGLPLVCLSTPALPVLPLVLNQRHAPAVGTL
jgi:hypothetical protein